MRKRIRLIALIMVIAVLTMSILTACKTTQTTNSDDFSIEDFWCKFIVVEEYKDFMDKGSLYVAYDKDTKVMYYITWSMRKTFLSPVYNADGTIKVYDESEK